MTTIDSELLAAFRAGTLTSFPHVDHVRTAYLMIAELGVDEATRQVSEGIRAMAVAAGAPSKFHVTRTVAWIRLVAASMNGAVFADSQDFLSSNPALLRGDLLDDYYLPGRLQEEDTRTIFLEPDVKPFE